MLYVKGELEKFTQLSFPALSIVHSNWRYANRFHSSCFLGFLFLEFLYGDGCGVVNHESDNRRH